MRYYIPLFLLTLISGIGLAQPTNQPADSGPDYSTYGSFVAARNIFNPDRVALNGRPSHRPHSRTTPGTPYISLVGTMDYPKGMFAFFNGNSSDYRKVLQVNDQIAGYTVKEITRSEVTLAPASSTNAPATNVLQLAIGAQLRQNGLGWDLIGPNDTTIAPVESEAANSSTDSGPAAATPAVNNSSSEPNDILKRLMQKREQEAK